MLELFKNVDTLEKVVEYKEVKVLVWRELEYSGDIGDMSPIYGCEILDDRYKSFYIENSENLEDIKKQLDKIL